MADSDVALKQWELIKFVVVSDGKMTSINEYLFTVYCEETGDVSTVQQLAWWNVEAETGGGEHNEILWSHHSHTIVMRDNISWVDELIYSDSPKNVDDLYSNTCVGKKSVMSIIWLFQVLCCWCAKNIKWCTQTSKEIRCYWFLHLYGRRVQCEPENNGCSILGLWNLQNYHLDEQWNLLSWFHKNNVRTVDLLWQLQAIHKHHWDNNKIWIYSVAALTLQPHTWHAISFSFFSSFKRHSLKTTFHVQWNTAVVPVALVQR